MKLLTDKAIETPRLVILAALTLCMIGFTAVFTLPKERTPRVKLPVIVVAVPNQGAPPATNEVEIVRVVEEEVGTLSNLREEGSVLSQAVNGAAVFQFVFDNSVDVIEAKRDVESLFNRVKGEFPEDAQTDPGPQVNDVAFEDFPVIQVFVAGGEDGSQRRRVGDLLDQELQNIPGVAGVDVFGGDEREVQIEIDPHRMTLYGFDYGTIANVVRRANLEAPTGSIESIEGTDTRVRVVSRLNNLDAIRQVPVGVFEGRTIHLADMADVMLGEAPRSSIARYSGDDAVVLLVRAKTDIDVMATAQVVQDRVDQFIADGRHDGLNVGTARSQAREIGYMLKQLLTSAFYGTIMVVIMLWLALGWRNAALISVAVPFAILSSAALMWVAKKTVAPDLAINNMTLFALILVIGMVVDGCIIVGENIFRHRELGESPVQSAKRGIHEVGGSLISAYMTTFAAFAPMYLVRGIMGDFMSLLPTVVMFSLVAAMLVDHFLLPTISVYVMKSRKVVERDADVAKSDGRTPSEIEIENIEALVSRNSVKRVYGRMLEYALHHRLLVLAMSLVLAVTPVALFEMGAVGFEFFPEGDVPIIEVHFEAPLGSSMELKTAAIAEQIEEAVNRVVREEEWHHPSAGFGHVGPVTTMGQAGALNTNLDSPSGTGPEFGMVYVELALAEDRERSAKEIREVIAAELARMTEGVGPVGGESLFPGVIMRVRSPSDGPPAGAPVAVRVYGHSETPLAVLAQRSRAIEALLRSIPGTYDVANTYRDRPELVATPNRTVAGLYDLDTATIASSINFALQGVRAGEVDFGGDEDMDLRIRNRLQDRDELSDLTNLPLRTSGGRIVALEQVAAVERVFNPNTIDHRDLKRVITVTCEIKEGVLTDEVKQRVIESLRPDLSASEQKRMKLDKINNTLLIDDEVMIEFGGQNDVRDDALEDLKVAMLIAAAAMLIILVVNFNSFVQPLIVLFSVPLSLVGIAIGHMICGFHFSISSMIGVVALSGIVVNDAIVLVDFINRIKRAGVPVAKAVVYAGQLRIRPIFLTTVTTIGGLLPLSLNLAGGGEFWQPLTITIMFGLGFATLLQLFVIPLACYTFDSGTKPGILDPGKRAEYSG